MQNRVIHDIPKRFTSESSSRRQKALAYFKDRFKEKKEWVKLNATYVAGTVTGTTAAFTSAYVAERCGINRAHATTWIAGLSAYLVGMTAICITWWALHKDKYKNHFDRLLCDTAKLVGNTFLAQLMTWGASWGATSIAIAFGASNALGVLVQQVVDRIVFIPAFNFMNRHRVKEMERNEGKAL